MDPNEQQADPSTQNADVKKKSKRALLQEIVEELRKSHTELHTDNDWIHRFLSDNLFYQELKTQSNQEKLIDTLKNIQQAFSALAESETSSSEFRKDVLNEIKLSMQTISSSISAMSTEMTKQSETMEKMCCAILSINTLLERQKQMKTELPEK